MLIRADTEGEDGMTATEQFCQGMPGRWGGTESTVVGRTSGPGAYMDP